MATAEQGLNVARRVDRELGTVEEAAFIGKGPQRLFGVLYRPQVPGFLSVVICPALLSESLTTYGNDVLLARTLAARGIAAYRFHYRGTGHSDGDEDDVSFESMREDALAAAEWLGHELDVPDPVLMGTRLGGLVAASAAAEGGGALVLWAPVLEGKRYFREAWRASKVFDIREGPTKKAPREETGGASFSELLERDGRVDILGYPVSSGLHASTVDRTLLAELGNRPRRMLLVHGGTDAGGEIERMAAECRTRGHIVDVETLSDSIVWWFLGPTMRRLAQPQITELLESTLRWCEGLTDERPT